MSDRGEGAFDGLSVTKENFGNAGVMFQRSGITSVRILRQRLLEGIEGIPGLGSKKINEFFAKLAEFAASIDGDGNIVATEAQSRTKNVVNHNSDGKPEITNYVASLSVGILRLGAKARRLREQGIETVGDLVSIWPLKYPNPYGLGHGSIRKIEVNLAALQEASSKAELISWESYAAATGAVLIPAETPASGAQGFLRNLPQAVSEIAAAIADPVTTNILKNRLTKRLGEQQTLEKISSEAVPRITRERVRQKEKKVLQQIAGGLISDEYGGLNILFRGEFTEWWRRAAQHFQGQEETGFEDFLSGLASVWEADIAEISLELPIILAIVTGQVQMSSEFRAADRLNSKFLGDLPESTRQINLIKLRLGKSGSQLSEYGYETLGDLCDGVLSGDLFNDCPHPARRCVDHLNLIHDAIDDSGCMNWRVYAELAQLEQFPSSPRSTANVFGRCLISDLSELIESLRMPRRAGDIFRLRTSLPPRGRMTLQRVASELGAHQPSIKNDESKLLQNLNDVLIHRNYSNLPFWVNADFLFFWEEAEAAYLISDNSYAQFSDLLTDCWSLSSDAAGNAIPSLWAVINGYPNGQPSGGRRKKRPMEKQSPIGSSQVGRIRLAGFRRMH